MAPAKKQSKAKKIVSSPHRPDTTDPVTWYARQVKAGKIVAGPHVRDACNRHLSDIKEGSSRGLKFDTPAATKAIEFFSKILKLNGGQFEGEPFYLTPWQEFCVGSIFGWKWKATNKRRFKMVYIETGKGSGKSPLLAGIGLICLMADGEQRAEVYSAATKKDQASILFKDAVAMVDQSPALDSRLQRSGTAGKEWNLAYLATMSYFRPISSEKNSQSGPRPHCALIDEVHEHKDDTVIEMMDAGTKFREQPIIAMITNSGTDKNGICWEYHEYACQVAQGSRLDDTFFGYVCALDENDKPFTDESCWTKANPNLGITIDYDYIRDRITKAKGMPSKESKVLRLNFCQWVGAESPAIGREVWEACRRKYTEESLKGRDCYGALDLSSTTDLTSLVLMFLPTVRDPCYRLLAYFWLPKDNLRDREEEDKWPYTQWHKAGFLEATPGAAISKLFVLQRLVKLSTQYNILGLGYDRWRIADLKQLAKDEGLKLPQMVSIGQGYQSMGPAFDTFEERLVTNKLLHNDHPVLNMCAANCVVEESPAGDRKPSKAKATGRIDGIVCVIMCNYIGPEHLKPKSRYLTKGIRSL